MAGKRSAREVLDEWDAKMKAQSAAATESAGTGAIGVAKAAPGVIKDVAMITTTPQRMAASAMQGIYAGGKEALQDAELIDRDRGWYMNRAGDILDSTGALIKQGAADMSQRAGAVKDAYDMYQQQQAANAPRISTPNPLSDYEQQMQGMDMESTPETKAYYDKMYQDSQMPMAQKAGQAAQGLLDKAGGAFNQLKGMGGQFMQGMGGQQQAAPAPAPQIDPQQIQQVLQSLSPEQKALLMQQLQGGMPQ